MSTTAAAQSLKDDGNAKFQAKQYGEAVQLYSQAILLDSNNAVLYSNRSVCQLLLGQPQEALTDAQQACELRPDWDKGHYRRGSALAGLGRLEQALAAFQHALELNPMNTEVLSKVRELKRQKGKKDKKVIEPASVKTPEGTSGTHPSGPQHRPAGPAGRGSQHMPAGPGGRGGPCGGAAAAAAAGGGHGVGVGVGGGAAAAALTPSGWAPGLSAAQQAEWLVDCYRIRLDDEYENQAMSGKQSIKTRGRYDINLNFPDEAKSTIAEDFLIFCKLAVQRGVIPPGWDWALCLSTASRLLPIIFERSDCQKKWGHEFVFFSPLMGRSLKHTGEVVYGRSLLGVGTEGDGGRQYSILRNRVLRKWQQLVEGGGETFGDVGGVELWKKLHSELAIKQPTADELMQGVMHTARRQMGLYHR